MFCAVGMPREEAQKCVPEFEANGEENCQLENENLPILEKNFWRPGVLVAARRTVRNFD